MTNPAPEEIVERIEFFLKAEPSRQFTTTELMTVFRIAARQKAGQKIDMVGLAKARPDLAFQGPAEPVKKYGKVMLWRRWVWQYDPARKPQTVTKTHDPDIAPHCATCTCGQPITKP